MANGPTRADPARARHKHGTEEVRLARHVVPPGPCLSGPRAQPSAQARHYGPFFVPGQPAKPVQNTAVFLFFYFIFLFFTKIYFRFGNLQEYTPSARLPGGRDLAARQRGGRGFCEKNFA